MDSLPPYKHEPRPSSIGFAANKGRSDRANRRPAWSQPRVLIAALFAVLVVSQLIPQVYRDWPSCLCMADLWEDLPSSWSKPKSFHDQARRILRANGVIDGHVDFPLAVRLISGNHIYDDKFAKPFEQGGLPGHVDIPRLRQGQVGGVFWSVYAPCPSNITDFSDENYAQAVQFTLDQIDVTNRIKAAYPDIFDESLDKLDHRHRHREILSPLGVEGLHQIGNRATNLRNFHSQGVRYVTLTHNCHNKYADAAVVGYPDARKASPLHGGVSPEGKAIIQEMNRIGMIVDLAHVSDDTMEHVLGARDDWSGSRAPVIFSHSSAYALCPHPRNVKDHILQYVKATDSVVMVNAAPDFIACRESDNENGLPELIPEKATIEQLAKHILHIGNLIGFDHVGVGSDFDGIESVPEGFDDISKYPDLFAELLKHGVSKRDVVKVARGNVLRVWKRVEAVAREMQRESTPVLEDNLKPLI